jgi:PAS domain S-box-containing protein
MSLPEESERRGSDNLAVLLFGGGLLLLLMISSWWVSGELDRARQLREQVHTDYQEIIQLQRVFSLLQDVETGARGYVLTRDPQFLTPYYEARSRLPGELANLKRLQQSPSELASFQKLEALEGQRLSVASDMVEVTRTGGTPSLGRGKAIMDQVRELVNSMSRAKAAEIDRSLDEDRQRGARTQNIVLTLFLTLMFGALAVVLLLRRYLETRQHLVAAAESEALRQRAVFDAAMDGIVILNERGHIERANPAAGRIFRRSPEELAGSSLAALLDPDSLTEIEGLVELRRGASAEAARREASGVRQDGTRFPLEVSIAAMTNGPGDNNVLAFMRDISDRREVEQMKDEFVSTVSHELRTPLTSIAGSLGLIVGGAAGSLPEKAMRLIGIAQANSQRLVRLINDVLDLEKLESGKLPFHFTSVDLAEVAGRAIEGVRGFADQLQVELALESEGPARVSGDVDRLVQVVTNLLSNAAKYSPKGAAVTVKVFREDDGVHLTVTDRGPGVPEAFRDRIFTRFAQADSSDARGKSGTGLGLYIAKEIAERHGGRLWFDTPPEGGASFHLDLPPESGVAATSGARDHVLLVEDEPAAAALLTAILEHEGLKVDTTGTLAEARQALGDAGRFGALVLDLRLPDGDGMDLVREIRGRADVRGMPIVVVSADAARGKDPAVRTLDVVDWMEKPVDPDRLAELVRGAIGPAGPGGTVILHVDDDRDIRTLVATALAGSGEVLSVGTLREARQLIAERRPDLVVLDLELRDGSGLDLLEDLRREPGPPVPVIVFSAQDTGDLGQQVAAVLVKSKTSLAGLVGAVRELVGAPEGAGT